MKEKSPSEFHINLPLPKFSILKGNKKINCKLIEKLGSAELFLLKGYIDYKVWCNLLTPSCSFCKADCKNIGSCCPLMRSSFLGASGLPHDVYSEKNPLVVDFIHSAVPASSGMSSVFHGLTWKSFFLCKEKDIGQPRTISLQHPLVIPEYPWKFPFFSPEWNSEAHSISWNFLHSSGLM